MAAGRLREVKLCTVCLQHSSNTYTLASITFDTDSDTTFQNVKYETGNWYNNNPCATFRLKYDITFKQRYSSNICHARSKTWLWHKIKIFPLHFFPLSFSFQFHYLPFLSYTFPFKTILFSTTLQLDVQNLQKYSNMPIRSYPMAMADVVS